MYGNYPQIQVGLLAEDEKSAYRVLRSPEWARLQEQLFNFVQNLAIKVVPARTGFQF
jgi:hypothetical protein